MGSGWGTYLPGTGVAAMWLAPAQVFASRGVSPTPTRLHCSSSKPSRPPSQVIPPGAHSTGQLLIQCERTVGAIDGFGGESL